MRYHLVLMLAVGVFSTGLILESKPILKTNLAHSGQQIDDMGNQFAVFIENIFSVEKAKIALKTDMKNTDSKSEK